MPNFDLFYHDHSPDMVKSRDSSCKFRKFFILTEFDFKFLGKVTKFGENWLKNKKGTSKKQKLGWKALSTVLVKCVQRKLDITRTATEMRLLLF